MRHSKFVMQKTATMLK